MNAKAYWAPAKFVGAAECITGTRTAGIQRRLILTADTWDEIANNLEKAASSTGRYFGDTYVMHTSKRNKMKRDQSMMELLGNLDTRMDKNGNRGPNNVQGIQSNDGDQKEECWFGHKTTTGRANGRTVWCTNPQPTFWPGVPSGAKLCNRCYQTAWRQRRKGDTPKRPEMAKRQRDAERENNSTEPDEEEKSKEKSRVGADDEKTQGCDRVDTAKKRYKGTAVSGNREEGAGDYDDEDQRRRDKRLSADSRDLQREHARACQPPKRRRLEDDHKDLPAPEDAPT